MIESLPRGVADYLSGYRVAAVVITKTGKLAVRAPADLNRVAPVAAWWTKSRAEAEQILVAIGEHHPASFERAEAEIKAAANRLGVTLSEHTRVMERASAAAAKLDGKLAEAQNDGDLRFFNREFKRRRIEAQRAGKGFLSYPTALGRLPRLLAGAAAGTKPESLLAAVFEDSPSRKTSGKPLIPHAPAR
jgi:hypothetical protein